MTERVAPPSALDSILPSYDAVERHSVHVRAAPEIVYRAILSTDLGRPFVVRLLMGLRAMPAALLSPRLAWQRIRRARTPVTLRSIAGYDFAILAESPGREIVLGIVGRFWRPSGGVVATDAERFQHPLPAGMAKSAWNFSVEPEGAGSRLSTETRVVCADPAARRSFLAYWRIVRPFSGLLRRIMLASIRTTAEGR